MSSPYSYFCDARAHCYTCGWELSAKNAHGTGVQHARRHGHHVLIEVISHYSYNAPEKDSKPRSPGASCGGG